MVQLGGTLFSVLPFWENPEEAIEKIDKKLMENKIALISFLNKADKLQKIVTGHGMTLTNNDIKDIITVIKSLDNRENLLKTTTKKVKNQKGGFLSNGIGSLMKVGSELMKNVLTPSAKSFLTPLGLTVVASATDAAIQKKIYGSGITAMIISNKEKKGIMEIVKYLEESGLLNKDVTKNLKMKQNNKYMADYQLHQLLFFRKYVKYVFLISYVVDKTLDLSIIRDKFGSKYETIFKEEESIEILEVLGLIKNLEEFDMNM